MKSMKAAIVKAKNELKCFQDAIEETKKVLEKREGK